MAMKKDLFMEFGADTPHLKVNTFGNYRIIGLLEEVSNLTTSNVFYSLVFNHTSKQHLLLKKYPSDKFHIDFFVNVDGSHKEIYFNTEGFAIELVAFANGYDKKALHFDYFKNKYFCTWSQNGNHFVVYFNR
jgi:hypothetical protein